jgi:hypothetical protein
MFNLMAGAKPATKKTLILAKGETMETHFKSPVYSPTPLPQKMGHS